MISYCINIDNGPEWELAQAELKRVGISSTRFQAIVEDNRVLSFNKSVYAVMQQAQGDDLLLFEDDIVFEPHVTGRMIWEQLLKLKSDFMTCHLGCNIIGLDTTRWQMPTHYGSGFAKLHNCYQSHATYYSKECVQFILDNFQYVTDAYAREGCMIFDEWLRLNVLSQGRSYVFSPMIAWQRARKSEIWNCHADYSGAHLQGNKYLEGI